MLSLSTSQKFNRYADNSKSLLVKNHKRNKILNHKKNYKFKQKRTKIKSKFFNKKNSQSNHL